MKHKMQFDIKLERDLNILVTILNIAILNITILNITILNITKF